MSYTDRFVQIPIRLVNNKERDMIGDKAETVASYEKILPSDISSYHPTYDDTIGDDEYTQVYFKSGRLLVSYLSVEDFETLLNEHQQ